jgi:DNA-binding MarR family transcriptional regulator
MAKQSRREIRALLLAPASDLASQVEARLQKLGFPMFRQVQTQLLTLIESGGMRLTDLVDAMQLPKQTLGDVIDDLESQTFVERYPDPEHGVIKRVRLAARGRLWASEVRKVSESTEKRWAALLGKAKVQALRNLLEELAGEIDGVSAAISTRSNGKRFRG